MPLDDKDKAEIAAMFDAKITEANKAGNARLASLLETHRGEILEESDSRRDSAVAKSEEKLMTAFRKLFGGNAPHRARKEVDEYKSFIDWLFEGEDEK